MMGLSSQLDFIRSLLLRLHKLSKRKKCTRHSSRAVGCVGRIRSLNIPTLSSLRSWREEPLEPFGLLSKRKKKRRKKKNSFVVGFEGEVFVSSEAIPTPDEEFTRFTAVHPDYLDTLVVDELREEEYGELQEEGHVCLDYSGYGLFSQLQQELDSSSSSFAISHIPGDLSIQAMYGHPEEGTIEFDIRRRVMRFLNIQEGEYSMVFTASRGAALKLLAESYPFHLQKRLLTMFDYESEAVTSMEEIARRQGAEVLNASFNFPSLSVCSTNLKSQLIHRDVKKDKKTHRESNRKKDNCGKSKIEEHDKKECQKGLFVFPVQSRVTGTKYSYQWMSVAQENGWQVLLDASSLGPKDMDSLGLSLFRPDFIVTSFYKVFGSDPTGFGCLFIKNTSLSTLRQSSAARTVGMVRLVPLPGLSSPNRFSEVEQNLTDSKEFEGEIVPEEVCSKKTFGPAELACSGPVLSFYRRRQPHLLETCSMDDRFKDTAKGTENRDSCSLSMSMNKESSHNGEMAIARPVETEILNFEKSKLPETPRSVLVETLRGRGLGCVSEQAEMADKSQKTSSDEASSCEITASHMQFVSRPERFSQMENKVSAPEKRFPLAYYSLEIGCDAGKSYSTDAFSQPLPFRGLERDHSLAHSEGSSYYAGSQEELQFSSSLYDEEEDDGVDDDDDDNLDIDESIELDTEDDVLVQRREPEIFCRGLNHADTLGLNKTNDRLRFLINWLISSLIKLQHAVSNKLIPLVHIYGPKVKYDRGAALAFNLFDQDGILIRPVLVQQLADRDNISVGTGNLFHVCLPEKCSDLQVPLEPDQTHSGGPFSANGHAGGDSERTPRLKVITVSLGFFTNFEDVYRLWVFVAKFLDTEFVKKELFSYKALNQKQVVLGL